MVGNKGLLFNFFKYKFHKKLHFYDWKRLNFLDQILLAVAILDRK